MKIISARNHGAHGKRISVHIDETKIKDGKPDHDYVLDFHWGAGVPLATIKRETKLLCQEHLVRLAEGTVLADEGNAL